MESESEKEKDAEKRKIVEVFEDKKKTKKGKEKGTMAKSEVGCEKRVLIKRRLQNCG